MGNMSHCRYQNTSTDLIDCEDDMEVTRIQSLSDEERKARLRLIRTCKRIVAAHADELETESDE